MDYNLISIINIIFVMFMLIILKFGKKYASALNFSSHTLVGVIYFFSFYKVLMYYFLPIILNILNNYKYIIEYNINPIVSGYLYAIETVSWLFWIIGYLTVAYLFRNKKHYYNYIKHIKIETMAQISLAIISLLFLYFRVESLINIGNLQKNSTPVYLGIFKSLANFAGAPCAVILLINSFKWRSLLSGLIGLLALLISLGTINTRGSLIYTIIFILITIYYSYGKHYAIRLSLIFPLLIGVFFYRGGLPNASIQFNDYGIVSINTDIDINKKGRKTPLQEIDFRFGALSRMSTKFIDMYERGDDASFNPISNSLKGFLPRSIMPNKPHPSTKDGKDIYSQGMYMVYRETIGYDTYTMVEFSTGGHAYWELGWFGVVILSTISGIYIALCSHYFQKFGVLSLALIIAIIKPWGYMAPKIWVSDIVLQIYQIILPLFILILLINSFLWLKNIKIIR